jgi:hypothetical protein
MRLMIVIIAVLHAGLAVTFKVLFFNYYVIAQTGPKDPIPSTPDIGGAGSEGSGGVNTTAPVLMKLLF